MQVLMSLQQHPSVTEHAGTEEQDGMRVSTNALNMANPLDLAPSYEAGDGDEPIAQRRGKRRRKANVRIAELETGAQTRLNKGMPPANVQPSATSQPIVVVMLSSKGHGVCQPQTRRGTVL